MSARIKNSKRTTPPPRGRSSSYFFFRGARWGIDLCLHHARLFDAAVLLGGYAESKGDDQQEHEAKALMQVPMLILMVHGLAGLAKTHVLQDLGAF